jgi:hypothetical protein
MSYDLVKQTIPNSKIVKIVSDIKPSLCRGWRLFFKNRSGNKFDNDVDNAFSTISWHKGYYQTYCEDLRADEIIDIANGTDTFSSVMREELAITDSTFDLAWSFYSQYGQSAKVIDLLERNT